MFANRGYSRNIGQILLDQSVKDYKTTNSLILKNDNCKNVAWFSSLNTG